MKDKNLPPDNIPGSLEELTKEANNIIEYLIKKNRSRKFYRRLSKVVKIK